MPVEEQNYPYSQLRRDGRSHSLLQHMDRGLFQNKPASVRNYSSATGDAAIATTFHSNLGFPQLPS